MIRKLLILTLLAYCATARAQVSKNPVKQEENKADTSIDYTLLGAPMPDLKLKVFADTANKELLTSASAKTGNKHDSNAANGKQLKSAKKDKGRAKRIKEVTRNPYRTNEDFDQYTNLVVMMFNPNCSHCEDETLMLEKNSSVFNKSKIILLANPLMWEYLPNFTRTLHVFDYPVFIVGSDSTFINKVFSYAALPQINIYNNQRKLVVTLFGEVSINILKKYLE
jgi:thiol-disulfide isomerase/thioredoxin